MLKAPPDRMTSRDARTSRRSPARAARSPVGAVEARALEVLDADRAARPSKSTRVASASSSTPEAVGMPPRDVEHALARARPRVVPRVVSGV